MDPLTEHFLAPGLVPLLGAARRVGLLEALDPTPAPAADLAARLHLHPEAVELVLDALVALGQCRREPAGYTAVPAPRGAWPFDHVEGFLRRGERPVLLDAVRERERLYPAVVDDLAARTEALADDIAAALPPARHMLDVGAGSGVWSLAMLARSSDGRVMALDLPDVLPRFLARAARLGLAGRVDTVAGDWAHASPRGPFDRVILANVLHLEAPAEARALVLRAAGWLAPGGDLLIVDLLPVDEADALAASFYALHLRLRTSIGRVHPLVSLTAWCRDAGLSEAQVLRAPGIPAVGVLRARAPG